MFGRVFCLDGVGPPPLIPVVFWFRGQHHDGAEKSENFPGLILFVRCLENNLLCRGTNALFCLPIHWIKRQCGQGLVVDD